MFLLSLKFLGTFDVALAGQPVSRYRSANVQGLLVYLALQAERPFPRDVLAALFWPDTTNASARQNLRQSLYQLRKVLNISGQERPYLHVTRQTVQFNDASEHSLDVRQFLDALDSGNLETAVSRYTGELLPGFTCDSLPFEDWLRQERERLHGLALQAMADLTARQLRNGRVVEAQAAARRQLELEPWSESAHRQLIEALALAGDRGGALAQFDRCRDVLAAELGLSPEPETIALRDRIQNNELRPVNPNLIAGRYALGPELGRGAMGVVHRGRDSRTGATVAIKKLGAAAIADNPGLVARFQQEAEALRRLNHPNIVELLAVDEKDGRHYLVMAFIPGGDLRQRLQKEGALPLRDALTIALDLADALTRAHRLDILHRDIKPGNVLLDAAGLPRLADFGLARLGQASLITGHEDVLGTVAYLSPEVCLSEPLDGRADIWSFGVLLYEMLLGERPFAAPTPAGTISHILNSPLPDVLALRPDIPEALADLLYRMLAKNRPDRIPSVRLVGAELEAIFQTTAEKSAAAPSGPPPKGRPAFVTPTPERLLQARHNLPAQTTPFIGREAELAELERLLADVAVRLVTILGPGGMGKTRLSLEIAARLAYGSSITPTPFPDGVVFVELEAVTTMEEMVTAVAAALGFAIEKEPEPQRQVCDFLSNKRLLLLLDNFERLIAPGGTAVVNAILRAAPQVKLLATSRQKLNLSGETLFLIEGLDFPDWQTTADAMRYSAVQLFVQSARRSRVDFALDEASLPQVTRICRLAAGMPLGIVLAAAWVDMLSLAEIGDEMGADIDFLAGEMGDLPPRQRSMRAVFEYSWELLTERERQLLARLSVFRGGFTREAAQAVAGASLRQLLGLVNKSLALRDAGNGRFSLHDLLRQLAAEKLADRGETDTIRTAHSQYYLSWLASHEMGLKQYIMLPTVRMIQADDQNIRTAWLWAAEIGRASLLTSVMESYPYYFAHIGGEYEANRLYRQALQRLPVGDSTFTDLADDVTFARASLLNHVQELGFSDEYDGQTIDIDRLHAFFRARGARHEEALVSQHLGFRALRNQDVAQAMTYFRAQIEIYEQEGEVFRLPLTLFNLAMMALFAGQVEQGMALGQRCLEVCEGNNNLLHKPMAIGFPGLFLLFEKMSMQLQTNNLPKWQRWGWQSGERD